jgi:BirA family biotin operon repressor/biotin-[acetyl-CoA-carboxylase] ligase
MFDWRAPALQRQLRSLRGDLAVEVMPLCASTNTLLLQRSDAAHPPVLLVAEQQSAGRGRQGRAWASTAGASLTFSLGLHLAPREWNGLSLAAGLAIAEALDPGGTRLGVKWPNDLWLADDRKLGGILIETAGDAAARWCVIGVGLNISAAGGALAGVAVAGLDELDPAATAPAALARVAAPLLRAVIDFEREGFAPLVERYARRDRLCGRAVLLSAPAVGGGLAEGVDTDGALLVRDGPVLRRVTGGEVSVRASAIGER